LERSVSLSGVRLSFQRDARFDLPDPGASKRIGMPALRDAMSMQLQPPNMQLVVVGDFDPVAVEALALHFLGPLLPLPRHLQRRVARGPPLAALPFRLPPAGGSSGGGAAGGERRQGRWFTLRPLDGGSGGAVAPGAAPRALIAGDLVVVPDPEARCVLMITVPTSGECARGGGGRCLCEPAGAPACTCVSVIRNLRFQHTRLPHFKTVP
jgi:hypothetical protein